VMSKAGTSVSGPSTASTVAHRRGCFQGKGPAAFLRRKMSFVGPNRKFAAAQANVGF
jgi:hypothetical protein